VRIRESIKKDKDRIRKVHQDAFGEQEGKAVSQLAIDLLEDCTAMPVLSLVAEQNNEIVGSIIFSAIRVEGHQAVSAYILAPLAVAKKLQGSGIGTSLINQGLKILRERGAEFVLVLGDPNYYSRTGFKAGHDLKPPYELAHPEAWMAQELNNGAISRITGTVQCATSLMAPEHW